MSLTLIPDVWMENQEVSKVLQWEGGWKKD